MRVLIVTAWIPWRLSDGGSLILHHQLRRWATAHDVTVLAPGGPPGEKVLSGDGHTLPTGVRVRWFGTRRPAAIDHAIRRVRSERSGEPAHVYWVERPALVHALRQELDRAAPSIVHLHGWGTAQLSRLTGDVPVVHMAIDAWGLGWRNRLLPAWRSLTDAGQARKVHAHERRHYPRCDAIVVVSPRDADYLRARAPRARVEVVTNGVEAGPEPGEPTQDPVVGFHANFETAANRDAAVVFSRRIFPSIRAARSDARALVVGRNPDRRLRRVAGDGVVVTGEVADVREWLGRMAVYVAPHVSGTGVKNKVLEAMAAGLPVVATPLALEGIGEGPGVFSAESPDALADRALSLLADPALRREAGAAARLRVLAGFTWDRNAQVIEELWEELHAPRPASP